MTNLGSILLLLAIIVRFAAILLRKHLKIYLYYVGSLIICLSFLLLVYGFVSSDFTISNVFLNSSSLLPWLFKIAASWSSHEGSMLLWLNILVLWSTRIVTKAAKDMIMEWRINILSSIDVLFLVFIILSSNPFAKMTFTPHEGVGLNPMLQDIALIIHPPLLYLGQLALIIPFMGSLELLMDKDNIEEKLQEMRIGSAYALMLMSIGIGLGSWWAYRELDWGGFWFFDPVENVSLIPWISAIILHHFLVASIRKGAFLRYTIFFGIFSFLCVIFSLFFVRSGIISSIHSFAFSPMRGIFILVIASIISFGSLLFFQLKQKQFTSVLKSQKKFFTAVILSSNIVWIIALLLLFIATLYPIYTSLIIGMEVAIAPDFFYLVFLPCAIPLLLIASIFFIKNLNLIEITLLISCNVLFVVMLQQKYVSGVTILSFAFASFLLLSASIMNFSTRFHLLGAKKIAVYLGHGGFAILVLAITINTAFNENIVFRGEIGSEEQGELLKVKLQNIRYAKGENYLKQIYEFQVIDVFGNEVILKPESRLYEVSQILSQEADIYSFLGHDLYAIVRSNRGQIIEAEFYYKPYMSIIWFAVFLIASSFFVLLMISIKNSTLSYK